MGDLGWGGAYRLHRLYEFSNAAQLLPWVMFRSFSTATFYIELRVRSAAHRITPCVRVCVVVVRSRGT